MFTGIGGFEYGIQQALPNAECVGYSEIDKYAIQTYERHFKHNNYGDATKIKPEELPDFDMLCGGFPCQAFSIAGKRRGFQDTRGTLFFDIARIVDVKRPKIVLLENVKGLLNHNKGETFRVIIQTLSELGYDVQWMVLNSKFFGVPQQRERVYIIGLLRGESVRKIISFKTRGKENSELLSTKRVQNRKKTGCNYIKYEDSEKSVDSYINKNNWEDFVCDSKMRTLTPIEYERLQGFPDGWTEGVSDTQRYKQCGNAVTTKVIKPIVEKLIGGKFTQGATPSFNKDYQETSSEVSQIPNGTSDNPNIKLQSKKQSEGN